MVFKLMEGFQSHHKYFIPKNFKSKNGREAKNDTKNVEILHNHYHIFNCHVKVDYSVLDGTPKYEIQNHMGEVPTQTEIKKQSKKWYVIKHLEKLA